MRIFEVFSVFLKLGLTSFGGPIAHLAFFRHEFVERRKWISEQAYADLVALAQFLPGPSSSQVGMALGLSRAGIVGALAAWVAFTLPSALILILFAASLNQIPGLENAGWIHGLKIAAVAIVAQALVGMARTLTPDLPRILFAVMAAVIALTVPSSLGQIAAILSGGLASLIFLKKNESAPNTEMAFGVSQKWGAAGLILFVLLLIGLPLLSYLFPSHTLLLAEHFYRAGALVFGGGHVVLPLLEESVVTPGWISSDRFIAGYGAAQAIPGPLFSFAAYLGSMMTIAPNGWLGAIICLTAIFLPSFLLIIGTLPFWENFRKFETAQRAMKGINAAVVGILAAALYSPVWTAGITSWGDFILALIAFGLLVAGKAPSWIIVIVCAAGGWILGLL